MELVWDYCDVMQHFLGKTGRFAGKSVRISKNAAA